MLLSQQHEHQQWRENKLLMEKITLSFTPEELRELAKQLYIAGFVTGVEYDEMEFADSIYNYVCEEGFKNAPETEAFRKNREDDYTEYGVSLDMDTECEPLIELYKDRAVNEHVPYMLAHRDFTEQYGEMESEAMFNDPKLKEIYFTIQKKYVKEFETYGITHLRLQEDDFNKIKPIFRK